MRNSVTQNNALLSVTSAYGKDVLLLESFLFHRKAVY